MRFQSEFCTSALQKLERLTARLLTERSNSATVAHSICAIDSIFVDLGRQVTANDDLGGPVETEEELVFRTARLIVHIQLDELDQAIRNSVAANLPEPARPAMWGSFLQAIPLAPAAPTTPARVKTWREACAERRTAKSELVQ